MEDIISRLNFLIEYFKNVDDEHEIVKFCGPEINKEELKCIKKNQVDMYKYMKKKLSLKSVVNLVSKSESKTECINMILYEIVCTYVYNKSYEPIITHGYQRKVIGNEIDYFIVDCIYNFNDSYVEDRVCDIDDFMKSYNEMIEIVCEENVEGDTLCELQEVFSKSKKLYNYEKDEKTKEKFYNKECENFIYRCKKIEKKRVQDASESIIRESEAIFYMLLFTIHFHMRKQNVNEDLVKELSDDISGKRKANFDCKMPNVLEWCINCIMYIRKNKNLVDRLGFLLSGITCNTIYKFLEKYKYIEYDIKVRSKMKLIEYMVYDEQVLDIIDINAYVIGRLVGSLKSETPYIESICKSTKDEVTGEIIRPVSQSIEPMITQLRDTFFDELEREWRKYLEGSKEDDIFPKKTNNEKVSLFSRNKLYVMLFLETKNKFNYYSNIMQYIFLIESTIQQSEDFTQKCCDKGICLLEDMTTQEYEKYVYEVEKQIKLLSLFNEYIDLEKMYKLVNQTFYIALCHLGIIKGKEELTKIYLDMLYLDV